MLKEIEPVEKSSWKLLREQSSSWWNNTRQNGGTTRFGHPDELAEHVVFRIKDFILGISNPVDKEKRELEMKKLISQARYSEIIDRGQQYYVSEYLPQNPDANPILVEKVFVSLA